VRLLGQEHGADVQRLLGFVKARIEDQTHSADPQRAAWAVGFLRQIEEMESFLVAVPPSVYEVERFLLRIAFLHRDHPDYQPHWDLEQPLPRPRRA